MGQSEFFAKDFNKDDFISPNKELKILQNDCAILNEILYKFLSNYSLFKFTHFNE